MKKMSGTTTDQGPLLGADFWQKGVKIQGTIHGSFETRNGTCYGILLPKPLKVGKDNVKMVSVGNLAGLKMALQVAGAEKFEVGDRVLIECVGTTDTGQSSPRVD